MNEEVDVVLTQLEAHVEDMPVERIVDELLLVSERLNFAGVDQSPAGYGEEQRKQIDFLLARDVSEGMRQFIQYLAKQHALHYVMDDLADMFITHARTYFSNRTQITVTTAVEMSKPVKQRVRELLLGMHTVQSRIIFLTDRSLVAGMTVQVDDHPLDDFSFKTQVVKLIEQYVQTKRQEQYAANS